MTIKRVKIEGRPELERDTRTMAVVNSNREALEAAKKRKQMALKMKDLEDQIASIYKRLDELEAILKEMLYRNRPIGLNGGSWAKREPTIFTIGPNQWSDHWSNPFWILEEPRIRNG